MGRKNVPVFIVMPPEERARLVDFAATVGRPVSWTVRDAVRLYLDAVRPDADLLARARDNMARQTLNPNLAGRTLEGKRGRPPKQPQDKANVR